MLYLTNLLANARNEQANLLILPVLTSGKYPRTYTTNF